MAKRELKKSIDGLSANFEFNIISYECAYRQWQSSTVPATPENKQAAKAWVDTLQAIGGTGTGPATCVALADKENLAVVLLTDGDPTCGASDPYGHRQMIRNNNTQQATITVFGIAAYGMFRAWCQGVAADSGGSYFDVAD